MNLYAPSPHAFSSRHEAVIGDLATAASVVLSNAVAYWGAYDLSQQLQEAIESRAVIDQAKGMLMARSPDLTADEAFDLLKRASQRENVKLRRSRCGSSSVGRCRSPIRARTGHMELIA
jgi:hypothetical protein